MGDWILETSWTESGRSALFSENDVFARFGFGFNEAAKQQGGAGTAEIDGIKRMLLEPIFPFANRYR